MTPAWFRPGTKEKGLGETIHMDLAGDLPVLTVPKKGFKKGFALLGCHFGSIDLEFTSSAAGRIVVPPGVAHFLEHKMFEKEEGDVSEIFAGWGASTNAMTSFNHTGYLVESTERFDRCLGLLVDFVTRPWFTAELVEKEKGIIEEEISMYDDDPSWGGFTNVLSNLYPRHPVSIDIAGSAESVGRTTVTDLEHCYRAFYRPANMLLTVAADMDPGLVRDIAIEACARNDPGESITVRRHLPRDAGRIKRRRSRSAMAVVSPKLYVGWKANHLIDRVSNPMHAEITLEVFLEATLGRCAPLRRSLIEEELIDDSFSYSVYSEEEFCFVLVNGDTPEPARLERRLIEGLHEAAVRPVRRGELARIRRRMWGAWVRSFDSVDAIAWNLAECWAKGVSFFDYGDRIEKTSAARVQDVSEDVFCVERWASHTIVPVES